MTTFHVKLLYIYKFIGQCLPIYAFYTILFIERGMSVTDIAVLMALWSVFTIVCEVPSGVLADRWNRRNMLVIAAVLQGIGFIVWFFAHTFLMFAIGFVFWAVAGAFTSGTEEGLTYDNLKCDGREGDFADVYGKTRFYAYMGIVTGIVSAGIMASFISLDIIALISAAICFVNAAAASRIREKNYYSERLEEETLGFFATFKEAVTFMKESRVVLISVLFLVFFANLGDYLEEFDALIIHNMGLENIWVSVILVIRFAFTALGNILASAVQRKISSIRQIFALSGLAAVVLLLFSILWNQYAFLIFGLALMVLAVTEVLFVNHLQNQINEEGRATVMSFYGIGQNAVMICFSLIYALLTNIFTLQQVYMIVSAYCIAGGASFFLAFKIIKGGKRVSLR